MRQGNGYPGNWYNSVKYIDILPIKVFFCNLFMDFTFGLVGVGFGGINFWEFWRKRLE